MNKEIIVLFGITVLLFGYAIYELFNKFEFWEAVSVLLFFGGLMISMALVILGINPFAKREVGKI